MFVILIEPQYFLVKPNFHDFNPPNVGVTNFGGHIVTNRDSSWLNHGKMMFNQKLVGGLNPSEKNISQLG